jgi:hypothetical protein
LRSWGVILATIAVLGLLLAACADPSSAPSPSGPEPLLTPNGGPKNEGLHGHFIPGAIWYQGHAYRNRGIIAHLKAKPEQPLPAFLSPAGTARYAVGMGREGSPYEPDPLGSPFPVYARAGTPPDAAVVAEMGLMGDRGFYTLYWEFQLVGRRP